MKLIKAAGFLIKFGLIGLGIAGVYVISQSGRDHFEILEALPSHSTPRTDRGTDINQPQVFSYADAVASSASAVVTIYTSKQVRQKSNPLLNDPIFSELFGDQFKRQEETRTETNLGSGVIISPDGYIITNQHVIDGADEILISLADGRGSQATLIGQDKETDIAILHIPIRGLSNIKIINQQAPVRVGDVVLAIGNPLNVGQTVTMGIISATGRNRVGLNTFENFIQTDAAINPGNSGGALVNARGELIGINTAIFSQSGGSQGIGFAIPTSIALDIMWQLIEHGKVARGWLGVEGIDITARAAMTTGNPNIKGALIVGIFVGSPADRVGIKAGDVMVGVDGSAVNGVRDLLEKISLHRPGDTIEVSIFRGSQQLEFRLQATERPTR
ncbi:MAG: trypsin-like serine protease [Gammaproteobacteria bacterium]|nr:trypsin-like serine protease [Gammaproteobacteria bacterium]